MSSPDSERNDRSPNMEVPARPQWQLTEVSSPHLPHPVPVIAARDVPYRPGANRFQNLTIYLPHTPETAALVGATADCLPDCVLSEAGTGSPLAQYLVHVHGGAWRDPQLSSTSIEPAVAHAFAATDGAAPIKAIAALNYSLSQFPTHPTLPYDAIKDEHADPAREATHPQHVSDVLSGLALLRSFGLTDDSYILSGHSCGACLAFQAVLQPPRYYDLTNVPDAPRPAAVLGLNGLYDLPELVTGLGPSHEHLRGEYDMLLSYAFGSDKRSWPAASPTRFDPTDIADRVREGTAPRLVVLDQSADDQLVPMNQKDRLKANLTQVDGLRVVEGHRCTGKHAAPWEQGHALWDSILDVHVLLRTAVTA